MNFIKLTAVNCGEVLINLDKVTHFGMRIGKPGSIVFYGWHEDHTVQHFVVDETIDTIAEQIRKGKIK